MAQPQGKGYLVGGGLSLEQLLEAVPALNAGDIHVDDTRHWTVSKLVIEKLGRRPQVHDTIRFAHLTLQVLRVRRGQVYEANLIL